MLGGSNCCNTESFLLSGLEEEKQCKAAKTEQSRAEQSKAEQSKKASNFLLVYPCRTRASKHPDWQGKV